MTLPRPDRQHDSAMLVFESFVYFSRRRHFRNCASLRHITRIYFQTNTLPLLAAWKNIRDLLYFQVLFKICTLVSVQFPSPTLFALFSFFIWLKSATFFVKYFLQPNCHVEFFGPKSIPPYGWCRWNRYTFIGTCFVKYFLCCFFFIFHFPFFTLSLPTKCLKQGWNSKWQCTLLRSSFWLLHF